MLRVVLIVAAGCVLLIAVLALTRNTGRPAAGRVETAEPAPVVDYVAPPAPTEAPQREVDPPPAPLEPVPDDRQMEDDAAAVGMTTREPEEPPADSPPSA